MKKLNDEEIQRLLEHNLAEAGRKDIPADDNDLQMYQLLFTELAKEPQVQLKINLSEEVVRRIQIRKDAKEAFRYYVAVTAIIIIGFIYACIAAFTFNPDTVTMAFTIILKYKWILIFTLISFLIIQLLDKTLVKRV